MNPFRRAAFDQLKCLGDRKSGGQGKQDMDMIFDTANFDGFHLILPRNAAQKWPEPFAQGWCDRGATVFAAENAMEIRTDVGHPADSAVPSGTYAIRFC